MDISLDYVKQCEKAREIQALKPRQPLHWNGWLNSDASEAYDHEWIADPEPHIACINDPGSPVYPSAIWLPRQDQLQEMMGEPVDILLAWFYDFCGSDYFHTGSDFFVETVRRFTSMEQLWLAFVMSEKYQKTWDTGKEVWVALD